MSGSDDSPSDSVTPREIHTDEIDSNSVGCPDLINPELVDESMILSSEVDDDGMQQALIETDDGMLIQAHRPDTELISDTDPETETEGDNRELRWCVERAGDFSSVI